MSDRLDLRTTQRTGKFIAQDQSSLPQMDPPPLGLVNEAPLITGLLLFGAFAARLPFCFDMEKDCAFWSLSRPPKNINR